MTNSNFFRLTPIFRVHSVLFFRVTKKPLQESHYNIQTGEFKIALLKTRVQRYFYRPRAPARDFLL